MTTDPPGPAPDELVWLPRSVIGRTTVHRRRPRSAGTTCGLPTYLSDGATVTTGYLARRGITPTLCPTCWPDPKETP